MFKLGSNDIGIDLGTANILIYKKGEGVILNQPSIVAVDTKTNKVLSVGDGAYSMVGRTSSSTKIIRPLKDGVIADFEITAQMLNIFLEELKIKGLFSKPKILICCPADITSVERKAIKEVAYRCGGDKVYIEDEPKVAAIGSGLEIFEPLGNMVIDIGGGTTDIAVLSMGEIVISSTLKLAGDKLTNDVINYVKDAEKVVIGQKMAEEAKIQIGCIYQPDKTNKFDVKGRDLVSGLPKTITLNEEDMIKALGRSINTLITETKALLEKTEPELASDIINQGIVVTGGGALIRNLDVLFEKELQVPVYVSEDPLNSVVRGTGILLELASDPNSKVTLG